MLKNASKHLHDFSRSRKPIAALAALALLFAAWGCLTVKPVVLDRKTQLENQILGTFQRLDDELILASSIRGEQQPDKLSPLQREAAEAVMMREFHRDDIEALKRQQIIGERNDGLLEVLAPPSDKKEAGEVERLVKEENRSRTVIMSRVIQMGRDLTPGDLPLVRSIFYRLNAQTARPGDKVQLPDGRWQVVVETSMGQK